jgi:hypothetical protein
MRRFVSTAAVFLVLAIPATASATASPADPATPATPATPASVNGTTDVSSLSAVQRDLRLAQEFWAIEQPSLSTPCLADQVLVTPMQDGIGDNGAIVAASDVWAETGLGSCTIDVAPVAWALGISGASNTSFMLCVLIAHEYGHTLGLPDTESIGMMSSNWARRDDPLCDRAVYGWRWTLHRDRMWIAANRPEIRLARRAARRDALEAAEVTAAASGSSSSTTTAASGSNSSSTTTTSAPSGSSSSTTTTPPAPAPASPAVQAPAAPPTA